MLSDSEEAKKGTCWQEPVGRERESQKKSLLIPPQPLRFRFIEEKRKPVSQNRPLTLIMIHCRLECHQLEQF